MKVNENNISIRRATMSDLIPNYGKSYTNYQQTNIEKNQENFGHRKRIKP